MEGTRPRYLDAASVMAAMPPVDERLALAERTLTALVDEADLPPKIGVHPRPGGSFAHAMPAALLPRNGADLLGIKWVTGFHGNPSRGLPAIDATVLLSDPDTGRLRAVLDAAGITAERTAAVSGVAIARFGPTATALAGRTPRVALIGAGVQGRSHLAVLGHVLPGATLAIFDRHADRADALAALARATSGIGGADAAESARAAVADADVVVTAASFTTPDRRQAMTADWLRDDALVVAVDYATMLHADVARAAGMFLVDERGQFVANRDAGQFDGYPDPAATLGEAILAGTARPAQGRVVVSHLGVGLADVVFGDAILARALDLGLGQELGSMRTPP